MKLTSNKRWLHGIASILGIILVGTMILSACSQQAPAPTTSAPTTTSAPATSAAPTAKPTASPTTSAPAAGVIEWKMAAYTALGNPLTDTLLKWSDMVKQRTNGRLLIKVYPASSLVANDKTWDAVITGLIDSGQVVYTYKSGDIPFVTDATKFPYSKDFDSYIKVWFDTGVIDLFAAEIEKKLNVKMVFHYITDSEEFYFRQPALTLADMKGRKIRGPGGISDEMDKVLGMVPMTMAATEVYEAASKKMIEGAVLTVSTYKSSKVYEQLPFIFTAGMNKGELGIGVNMNKWKQLPPDIQKIVMDLRRDVMVEATPRHKAAGQEAMDFLKKQPGVTVYMPPAEEIAKMRALLDPFWTSYNTKYGDRGKEVTSKLRTALGFPPLQN